jgi:hypothetical protein
MKSFRVKSIGAIRSKLLGVRTGVFVLPTKVLNCIHASRSVESKRRRLRLLRAREYSKHAEIVDKNGEELSELSEGTGCGCWRTRDLRDTVT